MVRRGFLELAGGTLFNSVYEMLYYRDAWKGFQGFPRNNAALAYVYIVQQVLMTPDSSVPGASSMDGFGVIVSTLK